ncbi:hypothetical protein [Corynebacterium comes]|uniref:hypothetical protein n=1 Tax=Corynebacterium comes TaxID=2675218 RepID=UPI0012E137C9|nr:hypothetical protein [Corynebacterium comes]
MHDPVRSHRPGQSEYFEVWGGLAERQRRALLHNNPQVDNWADFLTTGDKLTCT